MVVKEPSSPVMVKFLDSFTRLLSKPEASNDWVFFDVAGADLLRGIHIVSMPILLSHVD